MDESEGYIEICLKLREVFEPLRSPIWIELATADFSALGNSSQQKDDQYLDTAVVVVHRWN